MRLRYIGENVADGLNALIFPALMIWSLVSPGLLLPMVPVMWLAAVVIAPVVVVVFILERLHPVRRDYCRVSLRVDVGHFVVSFHLGYALALWGAAAVERWALPLIGGALWPTGWPILLQLLLACVLGESLMYWQHRLSHRLAWLWRFHALHHSGAALNLSRAGRFHFVDISVATFLALLPLVLLGTPATLVARVAALLSTLSILQHSNVRMHIPAWLDRWVCTPAVHHLHHSCEVRESDRNFGTSVMIFDRLFGTYAQPDGPTPAAIGIINDPVPDGFWAQVLTPFTAVNDASVQPSR